MKNGKFDKDKYDHIDQFIIRAFWSFYNVLWNFMILGKSISVISHLGDKNKIY